MNDEFEARIAELQQRSKAVKQHEAAELDRQKTALAEHANGIRTMLEGEFIDRVLEFSNAGKLAAEAVQAAVEIDQRHQALGEHIAANEVLLRRQARWAWFALGGACLAAVVIIALAIWGGARLISRAGLEADAIRVANAGELAAAREDGQRAIAALHEELAVQQGEIERRIEVAGAELSGLVGERDRLVAELEHFADLRDRLGIQLFETRSRITIVVPEGQEIRPWRSAGLSDLASYNGRMFRVMARE